MIQIDHDELKELVKDYYKAKTSLFIYGRFGIGKSDTLKASAKELAEEKKKIFVEWAKLTDTQKEEVKAKAEDYFVFIDIRLSEYDSSDIKGLPMFKDDKKSIEFKVPTWALLLENPMSDGVLFFDEINLAPPLVMSSCYKIIYDRIVNESKINDNWGICGAGNLDEDRAYTNNIAPPLKDRCGEVELVGASMDKWMKWGLENGINTRILGFANFKNSVLYVVDFDDKQKFTTYRGWARLSNLININNIINPEGKTDYAKLGLIAKSAIGEGVASEFVAFCKINEQINMEELITKPEKLKQIKEINVLWFVNTALADKYKENKVKFDKVMEVSGIMDEMGYVELVAYLWRMCYGLNKNFKKDFLKITDDKLVDKYSKYLY